MSFRWGTASSATATETGRRTPRSTDVSASVEGRIAEGLGYDAEIGAWKLDGSVRGDTFVDAEIIRREIEAGRYDLTDPLSTDPDHLRAIERSSLRQEEDFGGRHLGLRLALEGTGPGIGGRASGWTAGVEFADVEAHRLLAFRATDGRTRDVNGVLGSGGTSYSGERSTVGAFAEVSVPIADSMDVRAAARADEYDDVGGLRAWRLGAEYRPTGIVTLRGSWSAGDEAPSMHHLYSTAAQDHPYVRWRPGERAAAADLRHVELPPSDPPDQRKPRPVSRRARRGARSARRPAGGRSTSSPTGTGSRPRTCRGGATPTGRC